MRTAGYISLVFLLCMSQARSQAPPPAQPQDAARHVLIACVQDKTTKVVATHGITPTGAAYMVGLACSGERAKYQDALTQAGGFDVPNLLQFVDMRIKEALHKSSI